MGSHPAEGGAQAGSSGWAGVETLARPSSCRRNSELAGGWLPGTSGAAPWPTPPPLWPAGSFARTPDAERDLRRALGQAPNATALTGSSKNRLLARPSLPGRALQSRAQNHVGVTSPICGMKDHTGLQLSFAGAWGWSRGDGGRCNPFLPATWGILFENTSLIPSDPTHPLPRGQPCNLSWPCPSFLPQGLCTRKPPCRTSWFSLVPGPQAHKVQPQLTLRFSSLPPSPPFPPSSPVFSFL